VPLSAYRPLLDQAMHALIHDGVPYDVEFEIRRPSDQEHRYVHSNASYDPHTQCVTGIIRDVTDLKKAENLLRREQTRLRNILNVTGTGTWEWNIQTGADTFDANSAALLGYTLDELPSNSFATWMQLKHPDDLNESEALLQQHLRGETEIYTFESRMKHKNGSWVWVLGRGKVTQRDAAGKPLIMSGIHIDSTQLRQAEQRIKDLLGEKELLLREVHHRVKNNMSLICSLLSLQAGSLAEQAAVAALSDAEGRVASMMVLYDELYRSNNFGSLSVQGFLGSLVDRIVANFPQGMMVSVRKNIADFDLDVRRLQPLGIIVNELLTNCLKYAFDGRSGGTIRLSVAVDGNSVTLILEDDGVGIPECVDFEHTTGFGLTLVRELAKQMKATLRLEREQGSRFILVFDLG